MSLDGQIVLSHAFNAVVVDGGYGLLSVDGGGSFDDVTIKTDDPAFAADGGAQAMTAAAVPGAPVGTTSQLSTAHLDLILDAALRRFSSGLVLGNDEERLDGVTLGVADLPGLALAQTNGTAILVDLDAAGHGWFVDETPDDDVEFQQPLTSDALHAVGNGPARDGVDLLTVVMHELGHVIGLDHVAGSGLELMSPTLVTGLRLLPGDQASGATAFNGPGLAGNGSANRAARVFDEARGAFFALEEARLLDALNALNALNALDARAGDLGSEDGENEALKAALPSRLTEAELGDLDDGEADGAIAAAEGAEAGEASAELVSGEWSLGKDLVSGLSVDWRGNFSGFALRR